MKKKKISLLELKKSNISRLNGLTTIKGGTDTIPPPTEELPFTAVSYCETCINECASLNVTDCVTLDTVKTLGDPTLFNTGGIVITTTTEVNC